MQKHIKVRLLVLLLTFSSLASVQPVKNRVEFSEMIFINKEEDLCLMMTKVNSLFDLL